MNVSTKRSTIVANNVPVAPGCPPTGWWRSVAAPNFHPMALGAMKAAVEKVEMLGEPSWRDAVAGDAAAAVGMAILFERQKAVPGKLDLVMTALVICACEGSGSACVVLSNIIKRLPHSTDREARVATSWLVRAFRPLADRHLTRG
jgi:hypothetical protein